MVFLNGGTNKNMLDNGQLGESMATGSCFSRMDVSIRVNFIKISFMGRVYTTGKIKRHIMENGSII
jgi:hypothetical protein